MGALRSRLDRLRRRLHPAGLVAEWAAVLTNIDERWELTAGSDGPEAVQSLAREAAATGRDPGSVLAEQLEELMQAQGGRHGRNA